MTDNINVKPTPIQRNEMDVAMELLEKHIEIGDVVEKALTFVGAFFYA